MTISASEPNYAWWLKEELKTDSKLIEGIPLSEFDVRLESVGLPSVSDLPTYDTLGHEEIKRGDFVFRMSGNFNDMKKTQIVLVGAYKEHDGNKGRFLTVIDPKQKPGKRVLLFEKWPGLSGFSFLEIKDMEITWWPCLYCGGGVAVRFKNGKFFVDYEAEEGSDEEF